MVRDPICVASSFYSINTIPGKTGRGKLYLLDPDDEENILKISEIMNQKNETENDLLKCLWYWYEIEARIQQYKQNYPNVFRYILRTDELNDKVALLKMFGKLGMEVEEKKISNFVGIRSNKRSNEKVDIVNTGKIGYLNEQLQKKI